VSPSRLKRRARSITAGMPATTTESWGARTPRLRRSEHGVVPASSRPEERSHGKHLLSLLRLDAVTKGEVQHIISRRGDAAGTAGVAVESRGLGPDRLLATMQLEPEPEGNEPSAVQRLNSRAAAVPAERCPPRPSSGARATDPSPAAARAKSRHSSRSPGPIGGRCPA
jgi:hypothetical protein